MPEDLLVSSANRALGADLASQSSALAHYIEVGLRGSKNTQRAYLSDLRNFERFCIEQGLCPLPADAVTVSKFIIELADSPLPVRGKKQQQDQKATVEEASKSKQEEGKAAVAPPKRKLSTIRRHLAAIHKHHLLTGHPSPVNAEGVALVLKGITRTKTKQQKQAPAFTLDQLRGVLQALDLSKPAGIRDRALLLLGFFGAFRRSELIAINIEHLEWRREALLVHMHHSKTNQHGLTEDKAFFFAPELLYCPLRAVQDWLALLERSEGPLFVSLNRSAQPSARRLSAEWVNRLVQRFFGTEFSAHSLRSSFITIAVESGQPTHTIKNQTKHKSNEMIDRYTRLNNVIVENAASKIRL